MPLVVPLVSWYLWCSWCLWCPCVPGASGASGASSVSTWCLDLVSLVPQVDIWSVHYIIMFFLHELIGPGEGESIAPYNGPYAKFLNRAHLFLKKGAGDLIFTTCDCYGLNNDVFNFGAHS